MSIIGAEDEDFENDLDPTVDDRSSHFNSIELVKGRPTHLLVLLHHVILQFDCAPLLCYLHADLYLRNQTPKEIKKPFQEFYNTFLDKGAVLRVQVPYNVSYELDRTRPELLSDEQQRKFAQDVQVAQAQEVVRQLEDFRRKRMMGMTPNEAELVEVENHHHTDRIPMEMKEKAVAETLLDKMPDIHPSIVADEEKCSSIFAAVAFYMKALGVKSRVADSKKSKGFFRRPIGKIKDPTKSQIKDPTKSKLRGVFPGWIPGTEVKPKVEAEVEKDKGTPERKASTCPAPSRSHGLFRGPAPDTAPLTSIRKPGSTGFSSLQGPEVTDHSGINISSSPDSSLGDTGVLSSQSDSHSVSDMVDVSPVGPTVGPSIWEPPSSTEPPMEENAEKDSAEGGLLVPEATLLGPLSPGPTIQQEEQDPRSQELELDPPNWREHAPAEILKELSKKETKRQEVINELFATEHAHVRMLSVLLNVFCRPLEREELMTTTELAAIFPSLDEIIELHYAFYENLKQLRQDNFIVKTIGPTLLSTFAGTEGDWFQKLTSRFCSHQTWALELLKSKQKKEPRFHAFIQEAESRPQCRRLQLKDIIPTEMQRLTKYPLLLENIAKCTEEGVEKENIHECAECCKKILNHVNEEVKQMENLLTVKDYQRKLDTSGLKPSVELYQEYKNFDLTQKKVLYLGPLSWRVTNQKTLDMQCVLLEDVLVLLQKQDDKMVLKCQSKSNIVQEGKQMLTPIVKLDSAILRPVATDNKAFYVIFTGDSGAQIYELVAQSVGEMKNWTDVIKTVADELKTTGASSLDLKRGNSMLSTAGHPHSPTMFLHAPLSPTENGAYLLKHRADKDILSDDKPVDSGHSLIDFLSDKGFDLIAHSASEQEKVAPCALDEVMSLKRLLVGSISLSEDSRYEENGGEEPGGQDQDTDSCQSSDNKVPGGVEAQEGGGEEGGISAPLVLSQERMLEVRRRLSSLEEQLKKLQTVEEKHHQLQVALSKFSLERGHFQ